MIKLFENQKVSLYEVMKGTGLYAQHLYPYAKGKRNCQKEWNRRIGRYYEIRSMEYKVI